MDSQVLALPDVPAWDQQSPVSNVQMRDNGQVPGDPVGDCPPAQCPSVPNVQMRKLLLCQLWADRTVTLVL